MIKVFHLLGSKILGQLFQGLLLQEHIKISEIVKNSGVLTLMEILL